jgi:hypothetical protein
VPQAVSHRPVSAEALVHIRVNPCEIFGARSGTGTGFCLSPSAFPYQYHSSDVPYSLIYHLGDGQWARWRT